MADPVAQCSENCGEGDLVPEFLQITILSFLPIYQEYANGKLFEFDELATDGRCTWKPSTPSTFFNFEKVSRYWEGWNFPDTQPITNKWTWRVSVDRFANPLVLGGWSADFDRFIPPAVDPNHRCEERSLLNNYVPGGLVPQIEIEPLKSAAGGIPVKHRTGPCFCVNECPPTTRPYAKYLVKVNPDSPLPGYGQGKLFEHEFAVADFCRWQAVEPNTGVIAEDLTKENEVVPVGADHSYRVELLLQTATETNFWIEFYPWSNDDDPFPKFPARCDETWTLPEEPGTRIAEIIPVPRYICSDEEARNWAGPKE